MWLLISDANILIDMEEGELLEPLFRLPFDFCVPDILYHEELKERHSHLPEMGLNVAPLEPESMSDAANLIARYSRPSPDVAPNPSHNEGIAKAPLPWWERGWGEGEGYASRTA